MIFGIGVDMVEIYRIDSIAKRWRDRFLRRIFTREEMQYCLTKKNPSPHLAVRFAAKEAFLKALGTGYSKGVRWKDVEVIRNAAGRPGIELHDHTRRLYERHGIRKIHLSMSHDGAYGLAQVILEA
jgi:holo-[acyl-carrier protein] synthase